jgi:hypothetical protein
LKSSGDEKRGVKRVVVRSGRMRVRERMGKKMEGIKRGALPYVATSSFPPLAFMILQTTTRFSYFNFVINMFKWRSSI